MKKINCLGDFCPIPVLKTKKEFQKMQPGESIMIATDHSCTFESLVDYFKNENVKIHSEEVINGVWEITIIKI